MLRYLIVQIKGIKYLLIQPVRNYFQLTKKDETIIINGSVGSGKTFLIDRVRDKLADINFSASKISQLKKQ